MAVLPLKPVADIELIARQSYGRLLALLLSKKTEMMLAEDALAEAFAQAVRFWPQQGVPAKPEAWLYRVASNWLINQYRSGYSRYTENAQDLAELALDTGASPEDLSNACPDRRLALLFICAHPAIDPAVRTPLMLQSVLGLKAECIARAYSVSESCLMQRLVRAKRRIRDLRIPFIVPEPQQLAGRLAEVLQAIYGAYAIDWLESAEQDSGVSLAGEALYLAGLMTELLPDEAEVWGLLSLLCFSCARQAGRLTPEMEFVPLDQQNWQLWDKKLIEQAEYFLRKAHSLGPVGRFQLEAAIQSAHSVVLYQQQVDWQALKTLYLGLIQLAPSLGALVALAVSIFQLEGPKAALAYLDSIKDQQMAAFQPWWATQAYLLSKNGQAQQAKQAYIMAIQLTQDPALRRYLQAQAALL
jgi:predicted RNA polymerase sigma factor